jgi:hypothetical protein
MSLPRLMKKLDKLVDEERKDTFSYHRLLEEMDSMRVPQRFISRVIKISEDEWRHMNDLQEILDFLYQHHMGD